MHEKHGVLKGKHLEKMDINQKKNPPDRPIFIHSYLDEAGLDPYEFRAFAHVARRVGAQYDKEFFASLKKSADICGMSVRKLQYSFQLLCEGGFLEKQSREGRTDVYKLKEPLHWVAPEKLNKIREKIKLSKKTEKVQKT